MTATIHNLRDYELKKKRVHIDSPADAPLRSQAASETYHGRLINPFQTAAEFATPTEPKEPA